jgi:hypothetical protein
MRSIALPLADLAGPMAQVLEPSVELGGFRSALADSEQRRDFGVHPREAM